MPALLAPLFLALLVFCSCFAHGSVSIPAVSLIEGAVFIATGVWLIARCASARVQAGSSGMFLPFLALAAIAALQLVPLPLGLVQGISPKAAELYTQSLPAEARQALVPLSIAPEATCQEGLKLVAYFCIFFLAMNCLEKKEHFDIVIHGVIITAVAASLAAMNGMGPFANRNNFAGFLTLSIPLAMGYTFAQDGVAKKAFYGIAVGIMSLALFLSLSRGGLIVYFFSVLAFTAISWQASYFRKKSIAVVGALMAAGCGWIFSRHWQPIAQRFHELFSRDLQVLGHGISWFDILRIWGDFPFFGTGLGTFGNLSPVYYKSVGQVTMTYAHNDCLQFLSEAGVVGAVCAGWLLAVYAFQLFENWKGRHQGYVISTVAGALTALLGMLLYSFLDFNLHIPANAVLCAVIAGVGFKLSKVRWVHGHKE